MKHLKMDNYDKDFFSFLQLTFVLRRDLQLLGFTEADRLICENLCVFLIIAHLGRSRSLRLIHGLQFWAQHKSILQDLTSEFKQGAKKTEKYKFSLENIFPTKVFHFCNTPVLREREQWYVCRCVRITFALYPPLPFPGGFEPCTVCLCFLL